MVWADWVDGALENATNGHLVMAVNTVYSANGVGYWWIFIIHITMILMIAILTKHPGAIGIYAILASAILIEFNLLPIWAVYVSYIIIVFSFGLVLYWLFGGDG